MPDRDSRTFTIGGLLLLLFGFSYVGATCQYMERPYEVVEQHTSSNGRVTFVIEKKRIWEYSKSILGTVIDEERSKALIPRRELGELGLLAMHCYKTNIVGKSKTSHPFRHS
jgi:hypothetical protein